MGNVGLSSNFILSNYTPRYVTMYPTGETEKLINERRSNIFGPHTNWLPLMLLVPFSILAWPRKGRETVTEPVSVMSVTE